MEAMWNRKVDELVERCFARMAYEDRIDPEAEFVRRYEAWQSLRAEKDQTKRDIKNRKEC